MTIQEAEARILELEADLKECHRLRICENKQTAAAISRAREAEELSDRNDAQAEYFAGLLADMSLALGLRIEVPTNQMMSKIKELRKVAGDESKGTAGIS